MSSTRERKDRRRALKQAMPRELGASGPLKCAALRAKVLYSTLTRLTLGLPESPCGACCMVPYRFSGASGQRRTGYIVVQNDFVHNDTVFRFVPTPAGADGETGGDWDY